MKIAVLRITPEFLGHLFFNREKEIHLRIENGLPDDAEFYAGRYNYRTGNFELYYESEKFKDIPIPALSIPTFTNITDIKKKKGELNERSKE